MWYFRRVTGDSMSPTLSSGQIVIVRQAMNCSVGDVVVAFQNSREVIKRVTKKQNSKVYLEGDNKAKSTDSRSHGWLMGRHVMGKVIWPRNL